MQYISSPRDSNVRFHEPAELGTWFYPVFSFCCVKTHFLLKPWIVQVWNIKLVFSSFPGLYQILP